MFCYAKLYLSPEGTFEREKAETPTYRLWVFLFVGDLNLLLPTAPLCLFPVPNPISYFLNPDSICFQTLACNGIIDDMETIVRPKKKNRGWYARDKSKRDKVFSDFVEFMSLPDPEKCVFLGFQIDPKTGKYEKIANMLDFSKRYGVSSSTLSEWKKRPEFLDAVDIKRRSWGVDRVPNVLAALYNRCIRYGMAYDVETFLAFAGIDRKTVIKLQTERFSIDDLRSVIATLPADRQTKFYATIADIFGEANRINVDSEVAGDKPTLDLAEYQGQV